VVDNWAGRFQEELDYVQEMNNSEKFQVQMEDLKNTMGETVVVPQVFRELSSEKVLVSEWIEGTKLSKIDTSTERGKETVRTLSRVLLNSYLAQLLETGFLHADPHPGNFLVTSEGKLCILDYGLMTTVDEDKRFALLEFVSNLLAKNYEATVDGLVILGFVPDEVVNDPEKRKVVAPLLASVFKQISNGGGAFAINIGAIGKEMESLSKEYPLVIPPYFGLILRSFGALEGLGLSVDKDYSIVKECLPYLSSRLLSDDSERVRATLRTFLYGAGGRLDIDRVDHLAEGYRSFSATSAAAASGKVELLISRSMISLCQLHSDNYYPRYASSDILMDLRLSYQLFHCFSGL
jgi:aarF domain-containing kinase